jgi:hypothetical protein
MKGFWFKRDIYLDFMRRFVAFLMATATFTSAAAPITFQSSERQTALVELYTSEGCSSCPPAERWLSKLKDEPGLWTNFVPVAFHIDYWNSLGWRDKLSDPLFSARQQDYARLWSAKNIYTPEFVLNGKEWYNLLGIRGAPSVSSSRPGVLRVTSDDTLHWQVSFVPAGNVTGSYDVTAALLVSALNSDVKAGENAGRHLEHDFAALSLTTASLSRQTNHFEARFGIDLKPKLNSGRLALAVWLTRAEHLEPLQATGGWLPDAKQQ